VSETPPVQPFAMVGEDEGLVCVDGVCEVPARDDDTKPPPQASR